MTWSNRYVFSTVTTPWRRSTKTTRWRLREVVVGSRQARAAFGVFRKPSRTLCVSVRSRRIAHLLGCSENKTGFLGQVGSASRCESIARPGGSFVRPGLRHRPGTAGVLGDRGPGRAFRCSSNGGRPVGVLRIRLSPLLLARRTPRHPRRLAAVLTAARCPGLRSSLWPCPLPPRRPRYSPSHPRVRRMHRALARQHPLLLQPHTVPSGPGRSRGINKRPHACDSTRSNLISRLVSPRHGASRAAAICSGDG